MAHLDLRGDDHQIVAVHNAILDRIVVRVGYDGSLVLSDQAEAEDLVVQLQRAIAEQERHEGRELLRDEQGVRAAAEIREAL
ncbi:hypothetical protein [Rhodococcoides fascians]|uniref:hypothetical protein n=1 Tax=Rhodococcoides fascians TaxID=1828 RepID=UPI00378890BF